MKQLLSGLYTSSTSMMKTQRAIALSFRALQNGLALSRPTFSQLEMKAQIVIIPAQSISTRSRRYSLWPLAPGYICDCQQMTVATTRISAAIKQHSSAQRRFASPRLFSLKLAHKSRMRSLRYSETPRQTRQPSVASFPAHSPIYMQSRNIYVYTTSAHSRCRCGHVPSSTQAGQIPLSTPHLWTR